MRGADPAAAGGVISGDHRRLHEEALREGGAAGGGREGLVLAIVTVHEEIRACGGTCLGRVSDLSRTCLDELRGPRWISAYVSADLQLICADLGGISASLAPGCSSVWTPPSSSYGKVPVPPPVTQGTSIEWRLREGGGTVNFNAAVV